MKRSVLPKLIYEFNVVPLLKPIGFPPLELDSVISNSSGKITASNQENWKEEQWGRRVIAYQVFKQPLKPFMKTIYSFGM